MDNSNPIKIKLKVHLEGPPPVINILIRKQTYIGRAVANKGRLSLPIFRNKTIK